MKAFIFAISTGRATSIPPPLKPLSTYEERVASLLTTRHYSSATRRPHFKTIMIAAGFSGKGNSIDPNAIECLTCSLRLHTGYFTPDPLKEHFQNAPHCPLAIQLQQKAESNIAEKKLVEKPIIELPRAPSAKSLSTYEDRLVSLDK